MATQVQVCDALEYKLQDLSARLRVVKNHRWICNKYDVSLSTLTKFAKDPAINTCMLTFLLVEAAVNELEKFEVMK